MGLAASSPPNDDQLPRRSVYLLLPLRGVKVVLGLGPDELEGFAPFFAFPRVELHSPNAVLHIETKVLCKVSSCGVYHGLVSSLRLGGPLGCSVSILHVERETGRRVAARLEILASANTD